MVPGSSPATSPEFRSLWRLRAIQRFPGSFPESRLPRSVVARPCELPIALYYRYSLSPYVFPVSQGIALYPPTPPPNVGRRKIRLEARCSYRTSSCRLVPITLYGVSQLYCHKLQLKTPLSPEVPQTSLEAQQTSQRSAPFSGTRDTLWSHTKFLWCGCCRGFLTNGLIEPMSQTRSHSWCLCLLISKILTSGEFWHFCDTISTIFRRSGSGRSCIF